MKKFDKLKIGISLWTIFYIWRTIWYIFDYYLLGGITKYNYDGFIGFLFILIGLILYTIISISSVIYKNKKKVWNVISIICFIINSIIVFCMIILYVFIVPAFSGSWMIG